LKDEACQAFSNLESELEHVLFQSTDETLLFVVESNALDVIISTTLNQGGRPVVFLSRMLHRGELLYLAAEKEATAMLWKPREDGEIVSFVGMSSSLPINDPSRLC